MRRYTIASCPVGPSREGHRSSAAIGVRERAQQPTALPFTPDQLWRVNPLTEDWLLVSNTGRTLSRE